MCAEIRHYSKYLSALQVAASAVPYNTLTLKSTGQLLSLLVNFVNLTQPRVT